VDEIEYGPTQKREGLACQEIAKAHPDLVLNISTTTQRIDLPAYRT
jgi:hypothetical protein